jgi:hypothetical protein
MEHIYAAYGRGGLTKIGKSKYWERRLPGLRYQFKQRGDELIRFDVFGPVEEAATCEFRLMREMNCEFVRHSGHEWFISDDFNLALAITEEVVVKQINAERFSKTSKGQKKDAEDAAKWQAMRDTHAAVRKARKEERNQYAITSARRREEKLRRTQGPLAMVVSYLLES